MAVATYTKTGSKATTPAKLDKAVFGLEITKFDLLKAAYLAQQAEQRTNNAKTKLRGEVRGGGRKPWRQKGTGRARAGSIRSPLWKGGGVTFGPTGNQTFSKKISKTSKRMAIKQALSLKAQANAVQVIEALDSKDGKVKPTAQLLSKINLERKVLIVVDEKTPLIDRATRNLANATVVSAKYLSVVSVLDANVILFTKPALAVVHEWLGGKA